MNWNKVVRQGHRWTAIAFTLSLVVVVVALQVEDAALWLYYLPLVPLVLMLPTGLFMLIQPYASRWRGRRSTVSEA
ncbi:MAG: hypothetical protein ABWX96_16320 [Propionibacteriaceae bacterium]